MESVIQCFVFCVLCVYSTSGWQLIPISGSDVTSRTQFTPFDQWDIAHIVDGNDGDGDADNCNCCGATTEVQNPWFKVDLGQEYIINRIRVRGRKKYQHTLYKMEIKLGTSPQPTNTLGIDTSDRYLRDLDHTLPNPITARYIQLTLQGISQYFVICELYVYSGCPANTYGDSCTPCGNCKDGAVCDKDFGTCSNGCAPGYKGDTCEEECEDHKYGDECKQFCGRCSGGLPCNHVSGICQSCAPGFAMNLCKVCKQTYYGDSCNNRCYCLNEQCDQPSGRCSSGQCQAGYMGTNCNEECGFGRYGQNCVMECGLCRNNDTCSRDTGHCTYGCAPGYKLTSLCIDECEDGLYGLNCVDVCGSCADGEVCRKRDGACTSCAAGYNGTNCKTICPDGTYGPNCVEPCGNCANGESCNKTTGTCVNGCIPGYSGPLCKTACNRGLFGAGCNNTCGNCHGDDTCNSTTGECPQQCAAGYEGTFCKQLCQNGFYGRNCASQCGACVNGDTCNKEVGSCEHGCEIGLSPPECKTECSDGRYGWNCTSPCGNCKDGLPCNKRNGTCTECEPEYEDEFCVQRIRQPEPPAPPIGGIVGGIAAALVVIVAVVIVVIFLRRRNARKGGHQEIFRDTPIVHEDITKSRPSSEPVKKKPAAPVKVKQEVETRPPPPEPPATSNDGGYYDFITRKSDLKICQLWDYIRFKKQTECVMFHQEYSRLASGMNHPHTVAMRPRNRGKNRYKAIYAYDHTRVSLEVEDENEVDYINASFINGYETPRKFIASQGPIDTMSVDFWRMVWQQKTKYIVMLTNLIEKGTEKCIQYWSDPEKKTVTFGKVHITLTDEESFKEHVKRTLEVSKDGTGETMTVTQLHYRAWPDKSCPDSTWSLVSFWRMVEDVTSNTEDCGPILVHCSAGIGRTGTYIALDNAYYQTKREGTVRILDVVKALRDQRVGMVQTKDQYVFLHEAVADSLLFGTHYIWTSQFEELYGYMIDKDPDTQLTRVQVQFNNIEESIQDKKRTVRSTVEDDSNEYSNIFVQKQSGHVSVDEYRPKSKSQVYVREVGALILQNHEAKDSFIICKIPSESKLAEFWNLVKEQNVKTIVSLCDATNRRPARLGLDNKAMSDKFGMSLAEERKTTTFTETKINLKDSSVDKTVSVFDYNKGWTGADVPSQAADMVQFVEAVLDSQRRLSETEPVLVFCKNGVGRCGVVCVLLSETFRINREGGQVNIVETVKLMKERNEDIINSHEQFRFIYDAIRARDQTYQNQ